MVVIVSLVPGTICTLSVIGNSSPVLYTAKNRPTSVRPSVIDWKREAGRKAAAVSFSLRELIAVVPVRPVDEKLLPLMSRSASGTYNVQ